MRHTKGKHGPVHACGVSADMRTMYVTQGIGGLLMDQSKARTCTTPALLSCGALVSHVLMRCHMQVCGIGNIYRSEILYEAMIPRLVQSQPLPAL